MRFKDKWTWKSIREFMLFWVGSSAVAWLVAAFLTYTDSPAYDWWYVGKIWTLAVPLWYIFGDFLTKALTQRKTEEESKKKDYEIESGVIESGAGDGGTGGAGDAGGD